MIWHLNELELLVAFRENAFRENAPSSAAAVGAAVKAVEIADCDVATAGGQADSAMGRGKGAESGRVSMVILRDSVQFMPARGSDTQLLIALYCYCTAIVLLLYCYCTAAWAQLLSHTSFTHLTRSSAFIDQHSSISIHRSAFIVTRTQRLMQRSSSIASSIARTRRVTRRVI